MSWRTLSLGDTCEIVMGQAPSGDTYNYENEGYPLIAGAGDFKNGVINVNKYTTTPTKLSEVNDIILSIRASIGDKVWSDSIYCLGRGVAAIRPTSSIDKQFLWHLLTNLEKTLSAKGKGATFQQVNKEDISSLKIPLPPLPEQKRIAAILDKADEIRRKREAAIAKLDQLAQSIFVEMFGAPENNENWDKSSLQNVCELIHDCPHSTPTWTESGYVALRTSNLTAGGWKWDDKRFVSQETYYERSKRGFIEAGDIVLSREGTVGIAAIVPDGAKFCMGQRLVQLRASAKYLLAPYLLQHLLYVLSPEKIGNVMVGSTSQHLNVKELRELKIPTPPLTLQNEYVKRISKLEKLKVDNIAALSKQTNLFSSLQHAAFSGQL